MQISWSFNEMMERGRRELSHANNAAANGNWEVAAEYALKALTIFEIASEACTVTVPDKLMVNEYARASEFLEIARKDYLTYHRNGINWILKNGKVT